jgi:hypothetical protein
MLCGAKLNWQRLALSTEFEGGRLWLPKKPAGPHAIGLELTVLSSE